MSRLAFLKPVSLICVLFFMGCAATHTAINKRNLDVQTKMSASIFLSPVSPEKRTVFVQIRNTTDKVQLDLEAQVKGAALARGYQVVNDPEKAQYLLQANVLQAGQTDLRAAQHALNQGYGGAMGGALAGAAAGGLATNSGRGALAGGLIGAVAGTVIDAMVKDVNFSIVTDVQLSERLPQGVKARETDKGKLKQGTASTKEVRLSQATEWRRYQTRIVSTANKVNLKFEEAAPQLVEGISRSIAGLL